MTKIKPQKSIGQIENDCECSKYVAQQKPLSSVFQKNFNQLETHYVL